MRKKMLFVFGPESAGTRGTTKFLIDKCGYWGTNDHIQPLDGFVYRGVPIESIVPENTNKIVFRRSVPHAGVYEDLNAIDTKFLNAGYSTKWLLVIRDLAEIVRSKISRGHAPDQMQAWMQTVYQYDTIYEKISNKTNGVYFFPYTSMIRNQEHAIETLRSFGICD